MMPHRRFPLLAIAAALIAGACLVPASPAAQAPAGGSTPLLQAQAHLRRALELDASFDLLAEDAEWSWLLAWGHEYLRNIPLYTEDDPVHAETLRRLQQTSATKLLTPANEQAMGAFRQQVWKALLGSGKLLDQRTQALQDARSSLAEARRAGDASTELELTDLWTNAVAMLWRRELATWETTGTKPLIQGITPPQNPLGDGLKPLQQALAPLAEITPEAVLIQAAALARMRPTDPVALAGAADVISVTAEVTRGPEPWRSAITNFSFPFSPSTPERRARRLEYSRQARASYAEARAARDPDVLKAPWTVALQLYLHAAELDTSASLRYLGTRVYLLRFAFEPEEARRLLKDLRRRQPRNAVLALEQARLAFHVDEDLDTGMAQLREAAKLPEFERAYLVAVPAPLRSAISMQRLVRRIPIEGLPTYDLLIATLEVLANGRGERIGAATAWLRLQIFERFSTAPEYADRLAGVKLLHRALTHLLPEALTPVDRERWARDDQQVKRAAATMPGMRARLMVMLDGITFEDQFGASSLRVEHAGPVLDIPPTGNIGLTYDTSE